MEKDGAADNLLKLTESLWTWLVELAPRAVSILVVVVLGVLLAVVGRVVSRWLVRRLGIEALAERVGVARLLYGLGIRQGTAEVSGRLVFWTVLLLTLHTVTTLLGLPGLSEGMETVLSYLPRVLVSGSVLAAGVLLAETVSRVLRSLLKKRDDIESPGGVSRFVYYAIVFLSGMVAIEQLGLDFALINALVQIAVGAVGLGAALAFGFGARETFRNVVARFYVVRFYRLGDRIELPAVSGTIVAFSATAVVLQADKREVVIPCHHFMTEAIGLQRTRSAKSTQEEREGGP